MGGIEGNTSSDEATEDVFAERGLTRSRVGS